MSKTKSLVFMFLCASLLGTVPAMSSERINETYEPNVLCELGGQHGDNPDAHSNDVELLREALIDTYHLLPPDLQVHARETTFVINHTFLPATKLYMGWGPEDDPEYEYPDQTLYPEGTIKANCTERCVQFLALAHDELGGISNNEGARAYILGFFVHEFTHDLQYMDKPVRDLNSGKPEEVCPEGLCDPALVAETRIKIGYENEAFGRHLQYISMDEIEGLATDYDAVVTRSPQFFEKGGKYGLLGADFGQYYVKGFGAIRKAGGISGPATIVYNGQYRVPELALELHQLLQDDFELGALQAIASEWLGFVDQGNNTIKLRGVGLYIGLVEQRFTTDLAKAVVAYSE